MELMLWVAMKTEEKLPRYEKPDFSAEKNPDTQTRTKKMQI